MTDRATECVSLNIIVNWTCRTGTTLQTEHEGKKGLRCKISRKELRIALICFKKFILSNRWVDLSTSTSSCIQCKVSVKFTVTQLPHSKR